MNISLHALYNTRSFADKGSDLICTGLNLHWYLISLIPGSIFVLRMVNIRSKVIYIYIYIYIIVIYVVIKYTGSEWHINIIVTSWHLIVTGRGLLTWNYLLFLLPFRQWLILLGLYIHLLFIQMYRKHYGFVRTSATPGSAAWLNNHWSHGIHD